MIPAIIRQFATISCASALAGLPLLAGCAAPAKLVAETGDGSQQVVLDMSATIFFKDKARRFERARLNRKPDQRMLDAAYRDIPRGIYGNLTCAVGSDRFLKDCHLAGSENAPDPRALAIVLRLAGAFRLSPESPPRGEIDWVGLDLFLRKAQGKRDDACVLPFCLIEMAFPPPPPPPRNSPSATPF